MDELSSGETVFIKLGDLIEELSVIGQIASQDIDISININPPYRGSMRHIESLDARHVGRQWVELRDKKYSFCYQMYFSLDLFEVQADDRLLLDHCTYYGSDYYPLSCHELRIDNNIEALAYPFQLNRIVLATSNDMWRPADLMAKAVISCVEKKKYMTPEEMKQKQELFYDLASKGQTVKIKK